MLFHAIVFTGGKQKYLDCRSLLVTFFVVFFEYIYHQPNPRKINLFDSQREYTTANDSIISARGTKKAPLEAMLFFVTH